jgi:hypothetical protein
MIRLNPFQRIAMLCAVLAGFVFGSPAMAEDVKSGTFRLEILRVSFIGSVARATGVLNYGGKTYKVKATGLGVGGFGASKTTVSGTVYNLNNREDFTGTYVNLRSGIAVGDTDMAKSIYVENEKGVRLKGKPETSGVQLNLGADGFILSFAD